MSQQPKIVTPSSSGNAGQLPSQVVQDLLRRKQLEDEVSKYKETLSHELYDTVILKGGLVLPKGDEYELFATPIGEIATAANDESARFTKTEEHTNMREARRLSQGRAFSVMGMYCNVQVLGNPDTTDSEFSGTANSAPAAEAGHSAVGLMQDLQHCVSFTLTSDEDRLETGKLRRFTSPQGISGFAGNSQNNTVANNGFGRGYRLPIPRDIFGNRDFGVQMRVHRNILVTRTIRLEFILDGWLLKPVR